MLSARMLAQLAHVASRDADALYYANLRGRDDNEVARLNILSRALAYRARELGCVDQSGDALFSSA